MRIGPPAPWPGGGRRHKHRPCQCLSGGVVRAALGPLAWRGNRGPAMAPAARAAPAQKSAARFIICPHDAARAGLWSAGPEFARHAHWHWQGTRSVRQQERAAAARRRGDWRCPLGGAFDAAVPSSDGALAASGGNKRAVETLSPPPPPLERRAAVGRFLHGRVALSTAGQKCVRADLVLTASRSQGHN
jgi:hypothetical protein